MAGFSTVDISQITSASGRNFSSNFNSGLLAGNREKVEWSGCLDLVEVPGETEWKLRRMCFLQF